MIVAFVEFSLQASGEAEMDEIFENSVPRYVDAPGLIRKYYVLSEDGRRGGGIYLFATKSDAEQMYNDAWRAMYRARYGQDANITYYRCPIVVDNAIGKVSRTASEASAV